MRKNALYSSAVLVILVLITFTVVLAETGLGNKSPRIIRIIQRPGYFETKGNVFNIKPGKYEFLVENQAQKDAGFIVTKNGQMLTEVFIKDGNCARVKLNLNPGNYTYYCPIIPTASYPIRVR